MLSAFPHWEPLVDIIVGETGVSSAGFPYISDGSFTLFIERVPHLFREGQEILDWLSRCDDYRETLDGFTFEESDSITRALRVIRTMIYTANVTCLSDLWLLKQVFQAHAGAGVTAHLLSGESIHPAPYGHQNGLDGKQLEIDLHFLHARGYLQKMEGFFLLADDPKIRKAVEVLSATPPGTAFPSVETVTRWIAGGKDGFSIEDALSIEDAFTFEAPVVDMASWIAGPEQVELGYRLVPVLLALRILNLTQSLQRGVAFNGVVGRKLDVLERLLERAGWIRRGAVTELGARAFARAPGPVGIIHAYWPYMQVLKERLKQERTSVSVSRAANVAASQDANRKTFNAANDALDRFCERYEFTYAVFVEHAVGQGEATRQRYERSNGSGLRYFGADLEDAAIDEALRQQTNGVLPSNMAFIRNADIGEPAVVIDYLSNEGLAEEQTVMVVGNGFHEIRNQSNEKMIGVFAAYREAGFVVIFTEESALSDEHLIQTAWNTYHAGFRYVHEMSGQGLRPIWDNGIEDERWGWRRCAEEAGYVILDDYSYRSRTIYPYPKSDQDNPSISMTYFCIPGPLAEQLDINPKP